MRQRHLDSLLVMLGLAVAGGCGKKTSDPATAPAERSNATVETVETGTTTAADSGGSPGAGAVEGGGTLVVDGSRPVAELVLEPYGGPGGEAQPGSVKPDKNGRVKAGIYKVPGGSYVAVPEGKTVHVRPDESRGVMIGGLPFQLDTEVKLVGESDPGGLSFVRDEALAPESMSPYGPRYLKPGQKIEGVELLAVPDQIHQIVLHCDVAADSRSAFGSSLGRGLSEHFYIDHDGTVFQALDVAWTAYHAGEANQNSVGISLNNLLKNLEREPGAKPHPRLLPEGVSLTPPSEAKAPDGKCKLVSGRITCEIRGNGFGVPSRGTVVVADATYETSESGVFWPAAPLPPFAPTGVFDLDGTLMFLGTEGRLVFEGDDNQWVTVATGSKGAWHDAWVDTSGEVEEQVVVLVGAKGAISRSVDSGKTFARVVSGVKQDLVAITSAAEGRLVVSMGQGGKGEIESMDKGATWRPVGPATAPTIAAPRGDHCIGRLARPGEVCEFVDIFDTLHFVDAYVQVGELGLAYTKYGYYLTDDGGMGWEAAVTPERAAELMKHPRPVSERKEINGARVRSFGYTEPQYQALGALSRLLANVFPALSKIATLEGAEVKTRVLDDPAAERGVLAHWHWDAYRWDPGPGFDWARLARELEGRPE